MTGVFLVGFSVLRVLVWICTHGLRDLESPWFVLSGVQRILVSHGRHGRDTGGLRVIPDTFNDKPFAPFVFIKCLCDRVFVADGCGWAD